MKKRQDGLQVYLQRIAEHPVLSFNKFYVMFLTAKQSVYYIYTKHNILSKLDYYYMLSFLLNFFLQIKIIPIKNLLYSKFY